MRPLNISIIFEQVTQSTKTIICINFVLTIFHLFLDNICYSQNYKTYCDRPLFFPEMHNICNLQGEKFSDNFVQITFI